MLHVSGSANFQLLGTFVTLYLVYLQYLPFSVRGYLEESESACCVMYDNSTYMYTYIQRSLHGVFYHFIIRPPRHSSFILSSLFLRQGSFKCGTIRIITFPFFFYREWRRGEPSLR